jgi:hypothetical protein
MNRAELHAAALLVVLYAIFLAALLAVALWHAYRVRRERRRFSTVIPEVRAALVDYLAGSNDLDRLRVFAAQSPRELADAILAFEGVAGGGARDRLCEASMELGLVHEWCREARWRDLACRRTAHRRLSFVSAFEPCRRLAGDLLVESLDDPDAEVRLSAARGLAQAGGIDDVEAVFECAVSRDLYTRILLAEELRRHAEPLCERAAPAMFASEDSRHIAATLELLSAWERALPLTGLERLIHHKEREVRLGALRLAPYVPSTPALRAAVAGALGEDDAEVGEAASRAASRLQAQEALPGLALRVRRGPVEMARPAAEALAELGPRGWMTLVEIEGGPNALAAETAREALARVKAAT